MKAVIAPTRTASCILTNIHFFFSWPFSLGSHICLQDLSSPLGSVILFVLFFFLLWLGRRRCCWFPLLHIQTCHVFGLAPHPLSRMPKRHHGVHSSTPSLECHLTQSERPLQVGLTQTPCPLSLACLKNLRLSFPSQSFSPLPLALTIPP